MRQLIAWRLPGVLGCRWRAARGHKPKQRAATDSNVGLVRLSSVADAASEMRHERPPRRVCKHSTVESAAKIPMRLRSSLHQRCGISSDRPPTAVGALGEFCSSDPVDRQRAASSSPRGGVGVIVISGFSLPQLARSVRSHLQTFDPPLPATVLGTRLGGGDGDMGHLLVLQVVNEIRGKEAFADSALSVQNQV
jgi:hypothetical protein